ncbi:Aldo/keto reductase [Fulvimarina manganoxydans]|uniref:Aldo/keto reductase n=1 Tax=Fulvimarina manganoxydans TaxID=937218 RepID=A0A1W1YE66_9HYPH|nr:aldo/keto reductase [Fulvimarina manganoxydans]SMC34442.1 Aldo/keto reductase [Fulvimarina manganoxydans]
MRRIELFDTVEVPVIGQGTWRMGDDIRQRDEEIASLRLGIDLGMTLIDTAEIYGGGRAERLVGEAIEGRRDGVFLVSKVAAPNATLEGTIEACEASLNRLETDRIDLYLLHWRGLTPLEETIEAFERLRDDGKIRYWGVSNFERQHLEPVVTDAESAVRPAVNQLFFSLEERGIEYQYINWLASCGIGVMAYTPFGERGTLIDHPVLARIAKRHGATSAQIALAFVIARPGVMAIPKASDPRHVRENAGAANIVLSEEDFAEIDAAFPPPRRRKPLAII